MKSWESWLFSFSLWPFLKKKGEQALIFPGCLFLAGGRKLKRLQKPTATRYKVEFRAPE